MHSRATMASPSSSHLNPQAQPFRFATPFPYNPHHHPPFFPLYYYYPSEGGDYRDYYAAGGSGGGGGAGGGVKANICDSVAPFCGNGSRNVVGPRGWFRGKGNRPYRKAKKSYCDCHHPEVGKVTSPKNCRLEWRPKRKKNNSDCHPVYKPLTAPVPVAVVHSASPPGSNVSACSNKTTVMIRNIPNQFRRDCFLRFLDDCCNQNHLEYDFVYLPMDFMTDNNYGYAFVNLTSSDYAARFWKLLDNHKWKGTQLTGMPRFESKKTCEMTWAKIQGKEQLVRYFKGSNFVCKTLEYLPAVFSPPRNGSTFVTDPVTVGTCRSVSSSRCH